MIFEDENGNKKYTKSAMKKTAEKITNGYFKYNNIIKKEIKKMKSLFIIISILFIGLGGCETSTINDDNSNGQVYIGYITNGINYTKPILFKHIYNENWIAGKLLETDLHPKDIFIEHDNGNKISGYFKYQKYYIVSFVAIKTQYNSIDYSDVTDYSGIWSYGTFNDILAIFNDSLVNQYNTETDSIIDYGLYSTQENHISFFENHQLFIEWRMYTNDIYYGYAEIEYLLTTNYMDLIRLDF